MEALGIETTPARIILGQVSENILGGVVGFDITYETT